MARRRPAVVAATGVTAISLLLLAPSTAGVGTEMDEGSVVSYAVRVIDGDVPHRDFSTVYGPANPYVVAGAFAVFGSSVGTERAVGLSYRVVIALSLFILALHIGGLLAAVLAGVVAAKLMADEVVWAYATYGAMAFGLLGLALASVGVDARGRSKRLAFFGAGVVGGLATLMRFDFAPAIVVSAVPLLAVVGWPCRLWYGVGLFATAGLYGPYVLLVVGRERFARVFDDLVATASGRSLPLPGPASVEGAFLVAGAVVIVSLLVLGIVLWRQEPRLLAGRVVLATGLIAASTLPWVIARPDAFHVRPFAVIPLSVLPGAMLLVGRRSPRLGARGMAVWSVGVVTTALFPVVSALPSEFADARRLHEIRSAHRGFYGATSGIAARAVVEELKRLSQPGDSLFVGPQDLRRANYGPAYIYFLVPELEPASYYMEMNPGTANSEGSGLADELRGADWLILTSEWDDWDEPNDSRIRGPFEPNDVVRDEFQLRIERGPYRLYERRRHQP